MQDFINRANAERATAEFFSGAHARSYLTIAVAVLTAAGAGPALAAIWLGLALLADETRRLLAKRFAAHAQTLAFDVIGAATFAAAPLICWFGAADGGPIVAVGVLALLLTNAALAPIPSRARALLLNTPYAIASLVILADAVSASFGLAVGASLAGVALAFAAVLHRSHAEHRARAQDAEWVRQLNMTLPNERAAAWEIDFTEKRLIGAARLSALLGRPVTFADVAEGLIAAPADRPLVRAAFTADRCAVRRIAIEHAIDGGGDRIRHQGFVRTSADGAPTRITCVSDIASTEPAAPAQDATAEALAQAVAAQAQLLKTLGNELSAVFFDAAALPPALPEALRAFATREEEAERAVDQLARARHAAESANLAKSQFLANMSHELRTPLNAIIGYAEMLQEDAEDSGDASTVQDLNRILTAAKHLLSLLNEILDLSKIEAGRMDVAPAAFDPEEMLEELIETVRPLAEQNRNTLTLSCEVANASANTDAMKLRQCVLNLLSNACKFTRDGAIDVSIDVRKHHGVGQLFIRVRDTGIGMAPEHLARLFQPFVQADPSITQQYGGTGLGLTITRRLTQLLGGDVRVESKQGVGSVFTLHVPVNYADASAALGAAAEIDDVQGAESAPLILVIEDEPDARELAARALTRAGFSVQGVGGGDAGLTLARTKKPALILLDIFLPDRSGWRVLQSLKHDPKTQDIPVVVLSVNEDRGHALSLGAAEHMVKPVDRDTLAATVMRYARLPQAAAAAPQRDANKAAG